MELFAVYFQKYLLVYKMKEIKTGLRCWQKQH